MPPAPDFLKFTFVDTTNAKFERSLNRFARARHVIYDDFPEILRARDNIAGEIGEYFAIKALNNSEKKQRRLLTTRDKRRNLHDREPSAAHHFWRPSICSVSGHIRFHTKG
jgi:hypothetical protein